MDVEDLPLVDPLFLEPTTTTLRSHPDRILEKSRAIRSAARRSHKMRLYLCLEDTVICYVSFRPVSIDDKRLASIEFANCQAGQDRVHEASYILFNRLAQTLLRMHVAQVYYAPQSHIAFYRSIGFRAAGDYLSADPTEMLLKTARLYR